MGRIDDVVDGGVGDGRVSKGDSINPPISTSIISPQTHDYFQGFRLLEYKFNLIKEMNSNEVSTEDRITCLFHIPVPVPVPLSLLFPPCLFPCSLSLSPYSPLSLYHLVSDKCLVEPYNLFGNGILWQSIFIGLYVEWG